MTEALLTQPEPPVEVELITCDLCNHQYSFDPNDFKVSKSASAKCPRCSFNQTTIRKPRVSDIVAFTMPVAIVYVATIVVLLLNR